MMNDPLGRVERPTELELVLVPVPVPPLVLVLVLLVPPLVLVLVLVLLVLLVLVPPLVLPFVAHELMTTKSRGAVGHRPLNSNRLTSPAGHSHSSACSPPPSCCSLLSFSAATLRVSVEGGLRVSVEGSSSSRSHLSNMSSYCLIFALCIRYWHNSKGAFWWWRTSAERVEETSGGLVNKCRESGRDKSVNV
jgi:hypothetical protein